MSWRIAAVRDLDGQVSHYVAIQDDVTEDRLQRHRETRLVRDLQISLLPDLPRQLDFLHVGAAYRPAHGELPVGGDWYDAIQRDGGVDLVVGDVAGHGVEAVAEMGRLRWTVNALLVDGATPSRVAAAVNASLDERGAYATLSIVRVHRDGALEIVTCGAPPAALVGADGEVTFLGSDGPLLGLAPAYEFEVKRASLRAGSQLVIYSDGLTANGRLGDAELVAKLETLQSADVQAGATRLCDLGADDDDTAVLVAALAP
jgi:serine phosphatase RsbU (regulator of sigma subunit)